MAVLNHNDYPQRKLRLPVPVYWLGPVATQALLPVEGDALNAVRITVDTGVLWRHVQTSGTVDQQWRADVAAVYIGASARLIAVDNGVAIEVKNSSGVWIRQIEYTET
jgi:hypothetical protein